MHVHQPKCTKQRGRCSVSSMKGISGEKRSDAGKTKTRRRKSPPHPRPGGFRNKSGYPRPPIPPPMPLSQAEALLRKAQQGLLQKSLSHAEQQLRRPGRPAPTPDLRRLLGGGGGRTGEGGGGRGESRAGGAAAATAPLSVPIPRPTPGAAPSAVGTHARKARDPHAGHCSPARAGAGDLGARDPGPRPQDDAAVFVLPEPAGGLLSPGGRQPRPARAPPEARVPPLPSPGPGRAAGRPPLPPASHHSPCGGRKARAGLARDAGAVGPGAGLREGRAGRPGAAAAGRERGGGAAAAAAGSSFVPAAAPSVDGTRRSSGSGRREAGGGAEEEAEGGPEAAAANAARGTRPSSPHASTGGGVGRLRGRPRRARGGLGAARARGRCSPSPQLWPGKLRGSREASEPQVQTHTGPRSDRLTRSPHPALGQ